MTYKIRAEELLGESIRRAVCEQNISPQFMVGRWLEIPQAAKTALEMLT